MESNPKESFFVLFSEDDTEIINLFRSTGDSMDSWREESQEWGDPTWEEWEALDGAIYRAVEPEFVEKFIELTKQGKEVTEKEVKKYRAEEASL